ncbi:murein hydrolase activator EnvC family protein [Roseococcus microcysteis]|uniref:murein hydrolase activator EnvC family protein n=1 Tax=Roseococcus microcysteis TaxID=2771361 RepID=UPI00168B56C9|nr:peptidoglycan DD-metalloendopeptidase family protein [Roseococcus microcysteis]
MMRGWFLGAAIWLAAGGGVAAQSAAEAQRQAAEARRAAEAAEERRAEAEAEAERLATERVAGAARAQAAERALLDATERAEALATAEAAARAEVAELSARIAPLLPVLMRVAREPAPLLLAAPLPPEEVTLGLAAMRGMVREAQLLAARLRDAATRAREEAEALDAARARLAATEAAAREAAAALDAQFAEAQRNLTLQTRAERRAAEQAEAAIARATSLAEALARVEAAQARAEAARARAEARAAAAAARRARPAPAPAPAPPPADPTPAGSIPPVAGRLVRGFGSPGEGGPARGLTFSAAPGARVVTPCAGSIAFAAPFRSYGHLVIVECGAGQHLVLGGMARLDVRAGQRLRAGEPVGVLAPSGSPTLYVELRRRGEAVDPRPLLRI